MRRRSAQWVHAAKVASVATGVVAAVAVTIAFVLTTVFVDHLSHDIDSRLVEQLGRAAQEAHSPPRSQAPRSGDLDDPPTFIWRVAPSGTATPLTASAPSLPARQWSPGITTQEVAGTEFRMDARTIPGGWLVAGESVLKISQIRSDLLLIEALLGALLLAITFIGSFVIGLRASAPIEQIRRRQAEFTADASHELRTPLSVIEAEVDLALSRQRDASSYRTTLRHIASESSRLRSIVEDLLWLARMDGQLPAGSSIDTVDVASVAASCTDRFRAVADAASVSLTCLVDCRRATVRADSDAIDRLVSVLLDNACRYAGAGGTVEVAVANAGGRILLSVEDSGPGIPSDHRELVFDRFHRVADEPGGTGLGLAIADAVVRATDGSWSIGQSHLGGVRMEVAWHRAPGSAVAAPRSGRHGAA